MTSAGGPTGDAEPLAQLGGELGFLGDEPQPTHASARVDPAPASRA